MSIEELNTEVKQAIASLQNEPTPGFSPKKSAKLTINRPWIAAGATASVAVIAFWPRSGSNSVWAQVQKINQFDRPVFVELSDANRKSIYKFSYWGDGNRERFELAFGPMNSRIIKIRNGEGKQYFFKSGGNQVSGSYGVIHQDMGRSFIDTFPIPTGNMIRIDQLKSLKDAKLVKDVGIRSTEFGTRHEFWVNFKYVPRFVKMEFTVNRRVLVDPDTKLVREFIDTDTAFKKDQSITKIEYPEQIENQKFEIPIENEKVYDAAKTEAKMIDQLNRGYVSSTPGVKEKIRLCARQPDGRILILWDGYWMDSSTPHRATINWVKTDPTSVAQDFTIRRFKSNDFYNRGKFRKGKYLTGHFVKPTKPVGDKIDISIPLFTPNTNRLLKGGVYDTKFSKRANYKSVPVIEMYDWTSVFEPSIRN